MSNMASPRWTRDSAGLVLRGGGRARTGVAVYPLFLSSFLISVMSADEASSTGAECPMMTGEMACRAADHSAFETSCGVCMARDKCRRKKKGRCTYNYLHGNRPSAILDSRRQTL